VRIPLTITTACRYHSRLHPGLWHPKDSEVEVSPSGIRLFRVICLFKLYYWKH